MSKLVNFPNRQAIREKACLWLTRLEAGLQDDERRELESWLASDPVNAKELLAAGRLWDEMGVLSALSDLFPLQRYAPRRNHWRYRVVVATTVTLVCIGVLVWLFPLGSRSVDGPPTTAATTMQRYETAIGDQASVHLEDGTVVILNTDTVLDVNYSPSERVVYLRRGEAHFTVATNPDRPFNVHTGNRVVSVVGTIFNVRLGPQDGVEVTVLEGEVRLVPATEMADSVLERTSPSSQGIERTLKGGEMAIVDQNVTTVRRINSADIAVHLSWQHGTLIFQGEPLESVLQEVSRYTPLEFVISDPTLRDISVGGYFRTGDVDAVLVALRENFNINAQRSGNSILLTAQ